jgi:Zn-dependent protease with chaperone function
VPHAYNTLVVGTDAVAADAVAAQIMGYNPMADTLLRPSGEIALNHLKLANMKALGNNNPQLINVKNIT